MTMSDHARIGDPASSHRTVISIAGDVPLKELVLEAVRCKEHHDIPQCNDTWLWEWLESITGRRFQRNVLARARNRLVRDGVLVGVGAYEYKGKFIEHYQRADLFHQSPLF